ncbi:MAG TPA: T9SS type A sorting domain-containing protein, partial [Candidatus Kapabacteria bacterium]|nr:T9SS type A sorting domain-containing protein [Candidatus Kapabacteria bacterium]
HCGLFTADSVCGLSHVSYAGQSDLFQNSPNPFSATSDIHFIVGTKGYVNITLYDILGRAVRTIADGEYGQGSYSVTLRADDLPQGSYFYKMSAGNYICTRELTVTK